MTTEVNSVLNLQLPSGIVFPQLDISLIVKYITPHTLGSFNFRSLLGLMFRKSIYMCNPFLLLG